MYNYKTARSSTRVLAEPGGGKSSVGSLIFGGGDDIPKSHVQSQCQNDDSMNENVNIINNEEKLQSKSLSKTAISDAEKVRQFTNEAGQPAPEYPQSMNVDEVKFICKMIIDETLELLVTVMSNEDAKKYLNKCVDESKLNDGNNDNINMKMNDKNEIIGEQADAFVDIWYYCLNAAAKKGINLSKIFNIVHDSNMAKKDPLTNQFIKRDDGKIIKPKGWQPPNIKQEIENQIKNGSWN